MSKRGVLEIGLKLCGVYSFVMFVRFLPSPLSVFFVQGEGLIENLRLYILAMTLYPLLNLALAYLFVMKTEAILDLLRLSGKDSESESKLPAFGTLSLGIRLIGLYYFVSSSAALVALVPVFARDFNSGYAPGYLTWRVPDIWLQLATLLLSLVLIFKNGKVEEIITSRGIERNQPADAPDSE